jgi:aminoglycoside phosphotransferase (APT) family kinase protein
MHEGEKERLAEWLGARLGRPVAISGTEPLSTGYSAETVALQVGEQRYVLRRENPGPAVYPQQAPGHDVEVRIQHRVMAALAAGTRIPLAAVVGYEDSPDVVGSPFFVMEWVDGEVPLVTPSYAASGFFHDAAPADRRAMVTEGVRILAEVHTLDWRRHGLGWLLPAGEEPSAARQLGIWTDYLERELAGRELPVAADGLSWLQERTPPHDPAAVTLNWGDPRMGNLMWRDGRCVCVTDFEAACIAPFGVDLGWWLMFDRWSHEHSGAPRLEGEPTREEQAALYFEASGRPPEPTLWYEVFAALRYCAIVVRVINRTVERGLMPADNGYWRENQAVDCLRDLLR